MADTRQTTQEGRGWHGDPEGHAEAGRKGGEAVSKDRQHMAEIGREGGEAVLRKYGPEHMAEIGRLGGQAHHEAASHHEAAAHHHRQAAHYHEENDQENARRHAARAHEHATRAHESSTRAHHVSHGRGGSQSSDWQPHTQHGDLTSRSDLPDSVFAFPKQRKEPLTDASHVKNALARFDQVEDVSDQERDEAFARIKKAAQHYGVDIQENDWRELGKQPHTPNRAQ